MAWIGSRGGFCEKAPEAVPMLDRVSTSWLQDRPIAGPKLSQSALVADVSSTSVVTYYKKNLHNREERERSENM